MYHPCIAYLGNSTLTMVTESDKWAMEWVHRFLVNLTSRNGFYFKILHISLNYILTTASSFSHSCSDCVQTILPLLKLHTCKHTLCVTRIAPFIAFCALSTLICSKHSEEIICLGSVHLPQLQIFVSARGWMSGEVDYEALPEGASTGATLIAG